MGFPAVMPLCRLFVCQESNYRRGEDKMVGCWKYIESNCMNETCICCQIGFHNANYVTRTNLQNYRFYTKKCIKTCGTVNNTNLQCFQGTYDSAISACVCEI